MDDKSKLYELEKTLIVNNVQITNLTNNMTELTGIVKSLHDGVSEARGVGKIITWSFIPVLGLVTAMGGYLMNQYDKTNIDQYNRLNVLEERSLKQETKIVKIEDVIQRSLGLKY